jgi:hypothetical protein
MLIWVPLKLTPDVHCCACNPGESQHNDDGAEFLPQLKQIQYSSHQLDYFSFDPVTVDDDPAICRVSDKAINDGLHGTAAKDLRVSAE